MARLVRSWPVPWPVLAILVILAGASWIQGLRMAADRSARLQPIRTEILSLDPTGETTVARGERFALIDLGENPPARVGLYQILPARPLVRWIEVPDMATSRRSLILPLEGLPSGVYAVCAVDPDAQAGPVEMDRPLDELDERGRFRVTSGGRGSANESDAARP